MSDATGLSTQTDDLRGHADALAGFVAGLVPDAVPLPEVPELWAQVDRVARLGDAARLLLARRVEDSPVWQQAGCRSPAQYIALRSGTSVTAARDTLLTSKRLVKLPDTESALRSGGLSAAQTMAVADAATHNGEAEQRLLSLARRGSLAELRQDCARAKAASDPDPDASYKRLHDNRRLRQWRDTDGSWCLYGRGTPDAGAEITTAFEPIIDRLFREARNEGRREPRERLAFDALHELARQATAGHTTDTTDEADRGDPGDSERSEGACDSEPADGGGAADGQSRADGAGSADPDGATSSVGPRPANRQERRRKAKQQRGRGRSPNPRYLALLRLDLEVLRRGWVEGTEVVEIAGIGPIPVTRARDLLGDAVLKLVITRGVAVQSVTHLDEKIQGVSGRRR